MLPFRRGKAGARTSAACGRRTRACDARVTTLQQPITATNGDYILGAGDKLRITVFGEADLTGEYNIGGGGSIAFPLIGDIAARGRTPTEIQDTIRTRLGAGYIKDPRVAVEVLEYRTFYILGEVNKPGEYPYRTNLTLEQAVATAGGYTYRANRKRFAITHPNGAGQELRPTFKSSLGLQVQPGDTIRILERFF
ncbi:polysaccharide biosynthesis/export family protein [Sphingomonas solaris]|uniref:polysaccharide biosynthesis/export family protein n=1 Tax=Alterirhizorhabdus solaris TaxID=2529389 RepID=UPI001396BBA1|nr:polysaccharide biosynthesis/export family protein [Sphingomonas solaris]